MADALDALAPAAPAPAPAAAPAPAPAPAVASPSPAPPATPGPLAPPPASAPAPVVDRGVDVQQLARDLGYASVDEYKADLAFARRARAEYERRETLARQNDPDRQQLVRRNEAFDQLVHDRYGPDVARALPALPQLADYLHAQRADGAQADMVSALNEMGVTFDDSKESLELRAEWEDLLTDRINANPKLIERYNGTPQERREVVRELVGREERRINAVLLKQNAATMREHAARAASQPRGGRSVTVTPQVRQEKPTSTHPVERRRQGNAITSGQLDDLWSFHN